MNNKSNSNSGHLVTFEGIDGSGKSTVIFGNNKFDGLLSRFPDSVGTTEPNDDTWLGEVLREAIGNDGEQVPDTSILFLFLAEHANHVNDFIRPNLEDNNLILCDRYIDSRYVYQSVELNDIIEGNTIEWIKTIHQKGWTEIPDTTIILDISVDTAMNRLSGDEIFERQDKLEKFRQKYLELAENGDRYYVVDAENSIPDVMDSCEKIIRDNKH